MVGLTASLKFARTDADGKDGRFDMPNRDAYAALTLAEAVRQVAERHHEHRTRHISADEYQLLLRAAEVLEREHAQLPAFS